MDYEVMIKKNDPVVLLAEIIEKYMKKQTSEARITV